METSENGRVIYEFGKFILDLREKTLFADGIPIHLPAKEFETLVLLVENNGRALSKEEMLQTLWSDTFVEENNLVKYVSRLRKLLNTNGQDYIETLPKHGYRFTADVREINRNDAETKAQIFRLSAGVDLRHEENSTVVPFPKLFDSEADLPASSSSGAVKGLSIAPFAGEAPTTGNAQARQTISNAEHITTQLSRHKIAALIGLVVLLGVISALAYGIYRYLPLRESHAHFQKMETTRLTTGGNACCADVSSDGKFIAYLVTENGKSSIWTKSTLTESALEIVAATEIFSFLGTNFSPDGSYVYYRGREGTEPICLYQIPTLGGTPRKVLTNIDSPLAFSPAGKQFAYARFEARLSRSQLIVASVDGSNQRVVAELPDSWYFSKGGPTWSPDGKTIAIGRNAMVAGKDSATVVSVSVESGELKPLTQRKWSQIGRIEWFKDGSGLLLMIGGLQNQIWQLTYPGGEASRLTNELNDYFLNYLGLSADDRALVTTQRQTSSDIWVTQPRGSNQERQLTSRGNAEDGLGGIAWAPDGHIIYCSSYNLWIMNGDGGESKRLTNSIAPVIDSGPTVSPDGRYIVFESNREDSIYHLWRMDIDGSNVMQLTSGIGGQQGEPAFSPDGRWVVYAQSVPRTLWKIPSKGGDPVLLTDECANFPAVSPDGKLIACYAENQQTKNSKVVIIPFEGGAPIKAIAYEPAPAYLGVTKLWWSSDGRAVIYIGAPQGGANLWQLPIDGSPVQPITDFKSESIWLFDMTRDGRQFVIARGKRSSDVVMISDTR